MATGPRTKEILNAYEEWEPDDEPAQDLVDRLGISRQRLYQVLKKERIVPKSRRVDPDLPSNRTGSAAITDAMVDAALQKLIDELVETKAKLAAALARLADLA